MATRLGSFELGPPLGEGSVGRVFRGRHVVSGDEVAVKVLLPQHRHLRALALREVEAAARLDHAGVVWVHDFGDDPEHGPWVALELLTGGALGDTCPLGGWQPFADLAERLLTALAHAHAREVLHRDVKPANVLFGGPGDPRPGARLVDFGLAAVGRQRGVVAATPDYAAPEQVDGRVDAEGPWTDLYALGATLWHAACGSSPRRHPGFTPAFAVPDGFEEWLRALLASSPADRPANAARALDGLRRLGTPGSATPDAPRRTFDEVAGEDQAPLRAHPRRVRSSLGLVGLRPVPVVGRAAEQRALLSWAGGLGPAVAVLTGPTGIGKSHLLRWLGVRCREQDLATVVAFDLRGDAPVARAVAGAGVPEPPPSSDGAAFEVIARWATTGRRPVVALVDDTIDGAGPLVRRLAALRGLRVATTSRADVRSAEPRLVLRLGPLDPVPLVRAFGIVEGELAARLAERTAGHPGLTARMVGDLARAGRLVPGFQGWNLDTDAPLELPAGPLEAARRTVAALPVVPALPIAAALGTTIEVGVWDAVCARVGVAREPVGEAAWVAAGLVTRDAERLRFEDPLVRAVLEEGLAPETLRTTWGEAADVAAGRPELAARAAEWSFRAGPLDGASRRLYDAALDLRQPWTHERAWHLLDLAERGLHATREPERAEIGAEIVRLRAAMVAHLGRPEDALALLDAAPPFPASLQSRRAFLRAQFLTWTGRIRDAEEVLATIPAAERPKSYAPVHARNALERGDPDEALRRLADAPRVVEWANELGMVALAKRDVDLLDLAIRESVAMRRSGSTWPEMLHGLGAALRLREGTLPGALDELALSTSAKGLPYMYTLVCSGLALWAAERAPHELAARVAAVTEAIAWSRSRFAAVEDLLLEAAASAPEPYRAALLGLAATQDRT